MAAARCRSAEQENQRKGPDGPVSHERRYLQITTVPVMGVALKFKKVD
jgi:hypothetical protein